MSVVAVVRDISHHNKIANYDALRANAGAFQVKITEGTTFTDDYALRNGQPGPHVRGTAGKPRAPYHFARPVSIPDQIAHFLKVKAQCGRWERPDMLDCEFEGITGAFVRALKDEYRRQSGIEYVQIYLGVHELLTTCPPATFWDQNVAIQAARYRKIGAPLDTTKWGTHLGIEHPGITTYQWDNATPFYPGGPAGDISYDRYPVAPPPPVPTQGEHMSGIQRIELPASPRDQDGNLQVVETGLVLDIVASQGGAAGIQNFWVNVMANSGGMELPYCHWRILNEDNHTTYLVPFVPDGHVIPPWGIAKPANNHAPERAIGLIVDHISEHGGSLALVWN
jgi:hypothetical protein